MTMQHTQLGMQCETKVNKHQLAADQNLVEVAKYTVKPVFTKNE